MQWLVGEIEFRRLWQLRQAGSKPEKPSYPAQPIRARHAISFKSPSQAESSVGDSDLSIRF